MEEEDAITRQLLGDNLYQLVVKVKILVIGAGGIGCELIKDLALTGFRSLHILDLDTIDTTNLNRQFLFRKQHVGCSKAAVAREAVLKSRPNINVIAHHGNIVESKYGREFLQQFDVVLNALDNNEARRHVNRACLSLGIPLIDSGSTGYNGQVMPILGSVTRCFECQAPPRQKGFPVCTIRSTPSKPEHCIAWAKYLFELLFGPEDDSNLLSDLKTGLVGTTKQHDNEQEYADHFARKVFEFAFDLEIEKAAQIKETWEGKRPPEVLSTNKYLDPRLLSALQIKDTQMFERQNIWTLSQSIDYFIMSIRRMFTERKDIIGTVVFDKDDETAMDFVTAAANIRMANFNIELISRWDAESIAGSIIPAVASTNAIVSGTQVLQLLHLLKHQGDKKKDEQLNTKLLKENHIQHVWVTRTPQGPYLLKSEELEEPNPSCYVCQNEKVLLKLHNLGIWTLNSLVKVILEENFGCRAPIVELGNARKCIYDPDMEEDDEDFVKKKNLSLTQWGVSNNCSIFVIDLSQGAFECEIIICEDKTVSGDPDNITTYYSIERLNKSSSKIEENKESLKRQREDDVEPEGFKKQKVSLSHTEQTDNEPDDFSQHLEELIDLLNE